MLPNTAHQLKVSRFYLVLSGSASSSYGILYFRQDQPHIDLFVFFSVFFSCFFLFLAGCMLLWKAKQLVDRQRSRLRRQIEMQDMASRPFASVLVYMPHVETEEPLKEHIGTESDHPPHRQHEAQLVRSGSQHDAENVSFRLSPLAAEPTRNGQGVVATFMFELPCSSTSPVRACLGSTLLTSHILHSGGSSCHYVSVKQSTASRAAPAAAT